MPEGGQRKSFSKRLFVPENTAYCINVQDELPQTKILCEAQKYKKALKTAQSLASVASKGGMKTFDEQMMQMQALLESWQTGKPFNLIDASMHSIPKNVSEKIDAAAFFEKENSKAIPKTSMQSGDIYQANSKKRSDEKKQVEDDVFQFADVMMLPKMLERGRPKGARLTVIGLPKVKKSKTNNNNFSIFY